MEPKQKIKQAVIYSIEINTIFPDLYVMVYGYSSFQIIPLIARSNFEFYYTNKKIHWTRLDFLIIVK